MLRYSGGAVLPEVKTKVKVTTLRGTAAEKYAYAAGSIRAAPVLDHFSFATIASPQTLGMPFSVTIRAMDQYADPFTGYSGTNTLTYSAGEISPMTTADFSDGVWTGTITLTGTVADATITTAAQADPNRNGISNRFNVVKASLSEEVLFEEDFEIYQVGTFPYSGGWDLWYSGMGSAYQVIVDSVSNSPTKSLQLLGNHNVNWAAYAVKPIETDSPLIGFSVSVKVSEIDVGSRVIAQVGFGQRVPPNRATTFDPIYFNGDGILDISGSSVRIPYVAEKWYKVTVILDRNSETYSCWIDNELQDENIPVRTNKGEMTEDESTWDIECLSLSQDFHSVKVYFDDVRIFHFTS